jgi:mono/diheme cytochrome c family protein
MRGFSRFFGLLGAVSAAVVVLQAGCKRKEADADPLAEAKHLYLSVCAKCHGSDGRGGVPAAEGLPAPSNFTDRAFQASRTDDQLRQAIKQGKGPMPPFGALFDDTQVVSLVAYVRSFDKKK